MKKVMVVGALGFIGFSLCKQLLNEGIEVIGLDRYKLSLPQRKIQEQKQLEIARNANYKLIEADIEVLNFNDIPVCDGVFYCLNNENRKGEDQDLIAERSIRNLSKVLSYCTQVKARFIYLSSYEVYKKGQSLINEQTDVSPRNTIGELKVKEEAEITANGSLNYVIMRIPTVYGPWQPTDMTYQQIINSTREPVIDEVTEDAIYIDDIAELLLEIIKSPINKQMLVVGSGKVNQWYEGYELLNGTTKQFHKVPTKIESSKAITQLHGCLSTEIKDGVQAQRQHHRYIQKLTDLDLL